MDATELLAQAQHLRERARRQARSGQLQAAQAELESLLRRWPEDISAWMDLADVLTHRGSWKKSTGPLLEAARRLPRDATLVVPLAQELLARGEVIAARRCLAMVVQAPHLSTDLLRASAGMYAMMGEAAQARDVLERALAAGADDRLSHHMHGLFLKFCGDIDGARAAYRQCIERWPMDSESAVELVRLRPQTPQANLLEHVERQLNRLSGAARERGGTYRRAGFEYARFRILDDLDRPQEAWGAMVRCNRLMHQLLPYNADHLQSAIDSVLRAPVAGDGAGGDAQPASAPLPVFIVGMPRSGTTLAEQMLVAHSHIATVGETSEFERQLRVMTDVPPGQPRGLAAAIERSATIDFGELGERYLRQTRWRAGDCAFYIDKLPQNIRMVGCIRRALPQARIVHLVRDPMDVCFSNLTTMFGRTAAYSYDVAAIAHYYRQYARLVAHWHRQLPHAMLEVRYEDLTRDPGAVMQRVLGALRLEVEAACLHPECNRGPVQSPSSVQVREPIHRRGVGRWHRYESQLQGLKTALGSLAAGAS